MLFGYMSEPESTPRDDVLCRDTPLDCFCFERPLALPTELHVAGAMAFANAHGIRGLSLARWALLQGLHSAVQRLEAESAAPPSTPGRPQS